MSTLWLHCGAHKTATTSLQKALGGLKAPLRQLGFTYLDPEDINRSSLLADLHAAPEDRRGERIDSVRRFFKPLAARHENLLVSHESLLSFAYASPNPESSMRFYGTVPNALGKLIESEVFSRVVLILYIRRQDHYLESIYFEELKQGSLFHSFADYLEFRQPGEVSWLGLVESYEEWVLPGSIVLRPFESIARGSAGFLREFLEIFGWPLEDAVPTLPKLNARPSSIALNLHLRLARRLGRRHRGRLASRLFRCLDGRFLPPARPASPEQCRYILSLHGNDNRSVFERMPVRFRDSMATYRIDEPTRSGD